jgi:hypothetical protein
MELVFVLEVPAHPRIISTQTYHSIMILRFFDEADCCFQQILLVILLMRYQNSHYLLRPAIVDPRELPWKKLYENAAVTSFLHMTSLTREAFWALLDYIFDVEDIVLHRRHGRPCSMGPDGYLSLLLFCLGSTMNNKHLCLIFGLTPSVCSRAINWMLRKTVRLLNNNPFEKVKFPSNAKMREFAYMVQAREPLVDDIIGFMDGVSFPTECTSERVQQNAFYCGYHCDTMVNNVFAYGPDGIVFFAVVNFPGSWADGSLTARFLLQMKRRIRDYKICVDQGFPRSGDAYGTFVGPVTKRAGRHLHHDLHDYLLCISNVHTLLRQASEWGMPGLQGIFPRCKKCLPGDNKMQRLVLNAIVLVHNF